jgi:hypothetical protein
MSFTELAGSLLFSGCRTAKNPAHEISPLRANPIGTRAFARRMNEN